jgi:hypothetical protein
VAAADQPFSQFFSTEAVTSAESLTCAAPLDEGCARQRLEGGADTAVGVKIVRPCHATAGRFVPDVVPARPVRDVEHEGLALIALSQLDLTPIALTAADIKREPRFANSRLVWSYRLAPVRISMRMRVLQIVSDDGPMALLGCSPRYAAIAIRARR